MRCLKQLGRIGRITGGDRLGLEAIRPLVRPGDAILDVGCGGGDFAASLARRLPDVRVVGSDINPEAIAYAQRQWQAIPNLSFVVKDLFSEEACSYAVVTATLVCHHLPNDELKRFLAQAQRVASRSVLLNDLQRSWISYLLFGTIALPLFREKMIWEDGLLSIRKGFATADWQDTIDPHSQWRAQKRWPYRWIVTIDASCVR